MSRPLEELIRSILDDFAASKRTLEELEAKSLFRLLNYCPPPTWETDKALAAPDSKSK
jgi:hypothetical protein